jgi:DNA-binding NtrC family response regulator
MGGKAEDSAEVLHIALNQARDSHASRGCRRKTPPAGGTEKKATHSSVFCSSIFCLLRYLATMKSEPRAARGPLASGPDGKSQDNSTVVLHDPDLARARGLLDGLRSFLPVEHIEDFAVLAERCRHQPPAVLALPLHAGVPPTGGTDTPVLQLIRSQRRHSAIVVYADTSRLPLAAYCRALAAGARHVVHEGAPDFVSVLDRTLRRLWAEHGSRRDEEARLRGLFAPFGLIGRSPGLLTVFRLAEKASRFSDLPVLILGETGTGKQRLAEAIHHLDPRRNRQPFVTINCSAISKTLAESELFGHARGAFSGAGVDRLGLFRSAEGGTLLLDEIGDLDAELQPKLLRVLQERRLLMFALERNGGNRTRTAAFLGLTPRAVFSKLKKYGLG